MLRSQSLTPSDHVRDVGSDSGIHVEDVLEVVGARSQADGQREDVDDLVGVGAEEVGAEDAPAAFARSWCASTSGTSR